MMNLDPGVEHCSSCTKQVKPPLHQEHVLQVVAEKNPKLLSCTQRSVRVVKQKQKNEKSPEKEKILPVTCVKEKDIRSIKLVSSYPKKLTPIADLETPGVDNSVTKATVVGRK